MLWYLTYSAVLGAYFQPYHVRKLILLCWVFIPWRENEIRVETSLFYKPYLTHLSMYGKYLCIIIFLYYSYLYSRSLCLRCAASTGDTYCWPLSAPLQQRWARPQPLIRISEWNLFVIQQHPLIILSLEHQYPCSEFGRKSEKIVFWIWSTTWRTKIKSKSEENQIRCSE